MQSIEPDQMPRVHVVAGVVINDREEVFIAQRGSHQHQGGLWEFPGGKKEPGEDGLQALRRELDEELGIKVLGAKPLTQICHDYPDKAVLLDFWLVESFEGLPRGVEGQRVLWVPIADLHRYDFPAANRSIVKMLQNNESSVVS